MSRKNTAAIEPKPNAPFRCTIPESSSMTCMTQVTAIELAHLTASLKAAGIIPSPKEQQDEAHEIGISDRKLVLEAAEFLALCNEVKAVMSEAQRWEDLKIKISKELEVIAQKLNYERIPVKELIRVAGADRLTLTSSELATLNVTKGWEEMTTDEQAVEIFMHLSSRKFQGAILIPDRQSGEFFSQRSYLLQVSLKDASLSKKSNRFNPVDSKTHEKGVSSETRPEEGTSPALELTGDLEQDNRALLQRNIADNEAARRRLCELGIPTSFDTLLNIVISLREAKSQRDSGLKRSAAMKSRQGEGKKAKGTKTERRGDGTRRKQNRDNTSGRFKEDKIRSPLAEAVSLNKHQRPKIEG
jgi:hypothetical protein